MNRSNYLKEETLLFERSSGGPLNILTCFPNTYKIGMASLGYQTIFKLFASHTQTHCFRFFTDFAEHQPKDLDLITVSVSWELDFFNVFEIFKKLNIPFKAQDRGPEHPLVLGGGPVLSANPEPWAEFFDLIAIGDCENNADALIETCVEYQNSTNKQNKDLKQFTEIPGIYVPKYHPDYQEKIAKEKNSNSFVQTKVTREKSNKSDLAYSSVIAPSSCWQDVGLLEVARSCPELCRFCLASYLTLPFRTPELETDLMPKVSQLLKHTQNIGLLGASVTQHPEFMELLRFLAQHPSEPQVQVASMRASTVNGEMCELLKKCGTKNLTIAIESGSGRLREIINKKLPEEYIFAAAEAASKANLRSLKLYGMVGLPHETDSDIDATIDLLLRLKQANKQLKIIWGCSVFTPKAQTPFQDYGIDPSSEGKLKKLIKALKPKGIEVREESYKWAQVQALISRGDRSLADVFVSIYQSNKTNFSAYKKYMNKKDYEHFVFGDWSEIIESGNYQYPWHLLIDDKQKAILQGHKQHAISLS